MRVPLRKRRSAQNASGQPADLDAQFTVLGLSHGADAGLMEIAYRCQLGRLSAEGEANASAPDRRRRLDEAVAALRIALDSEGGRRPRWTRPDTSDPYESLHLHRPAGQELIAAAYTHALRSALAAKGDDGVAALEWAYSQIGTAEARIAHDRLHPPKRGRRSRRKPHRAVSLDRAGPARAASAATSPDGAIGLRRVLAALAKRRSRSGSQEPDPATGPRTDVSVPIIARPVRAMSITLGGEMVETVELQDGAAYIIGSAVHCDIPLVPPVLEAAGSIAPEHARVAAGIGGVSFRQIAEHAETFVNGKPVRWMLLEPGDELWIGPYRCRYEIARYDVDRWRVTAWS